MWKFLKKLKIDLPYDPAVSLLGIYSEKPIIQKDTCTPVFIAALFTIDRTWKQPKCPLIDEWIKMWYIYTIEYCCCCYCLVTKSNMTVCDPMDCSMPGFPVFHHLLKFAQIHVH